MSGFWDGVSSVWIMEHDRGLRVNGHKTRVDAIADLMIRDLIRDPSDANRASIRAMVERMMSMYEDGEVAPVGEDG